MNQSVIIQHMVFDFDGLVGKDGELVLHDIHLVVQGEGVLFEDFGSDELEPELGEGSGSNWAENDSIHVTLVIVADFCIHQIPRIELWFQEVV